MSVAGSFTPERTSSVLVAACRAAGLDSSGVTSLGFGENALYFLPRERKVIRIGRSMVAAVKEVLVAAWLADNGFPAVQVAAGFRDGPIVVDGLPVTVWDYISESGPPITAGEFGRVLHDLHAVPEPAQFQLPRFSPMPKVKGRLQQLTQMNFPEPELTFLAAHCDRLAAEYSSLRFELPPGPIHGDSHPGNLMRTEHGAILLLDLEDFCYGPREWDAAVMGVRHQAFGWESDEEYQSYVEAYGYNPLDWPGFPVLRAIRELNMTTWLSQRFDESAEVAAEVLKRVHDLGNDQALRDWRVF
jgi:aminoglycoside phosphotransferase (APT) family kinase protein